MLAPSTIRRKYKRWKFSLSLSKRQLFIIATFALACGLLLTQLVSLELRYPMVIGLSLLTYGMTTFVLRDDLRGIEWLTLPLLPMLFTGATALFYFLLPTRWLTRLPVVVIYTVGMYALLLTENIYNVAANRTIALLRAGHSVGFLLTLVTYFSLLQAILAFRFLGVVNVFLIGLVSFLLVFQALWSYELGEKVSHSAWRLTMVLTVVCMQLAWAFSFWPIKSTLLALLLTTSLYSMIGMAQNYLIERLYKKTIVEFLIVTIIVFILVIFATRWRGNL